MKRTITDLQSLLKERDTEISGLRQKLMKS